MPELIDRQAALEIAMSYCPDDDGCCSKAGHDIREMLDEIEALPTIDLEVRHGRWNYRHEDDWCYCTACGTDAEGSDGECFETNYCPNCGAKMDK